MLTTSQGSPESSDLISHEMYLHSLNKCSAFTSLERELLGLDRKINTYFIKFR